MEDKKNPNTTVIFPTSQSLTLTRAELRSMFEFFELTKTNRLSYLPYLCNVPLNGKPRLEEKIKIALPHLSKANAEEIFLPLLMPDRVIDVCSAMYGQAPNRMQLYASRKAGHFIGIRAIDADQLELTLPITPSHIIGWLEQNLQFSGPLILPSLFGQYDGQQLAFLLALIDAFKQSFFQSHLNRQSEPPPITLQASDILNFDNAGRTQTDRRWLITAIREMLIQLVHIGGAVQVELPGLDENFLRQECLRYQKAGFLIPDGGADKYKAGNNLAQVAADLSQWICIVCLHDLQINGGAREKPTAIEELAFFIGTQTTIWMLVSNGLTDAKKDLSRVEFGMRSSPIFNVYSFAQKFLEPLPGITIPDSFYKGFVPLVEKDTEQISGQPAGAPLQAASTPRFCRHCGQPLPETQGEYRFCRHCGRPLT